MPFWLEYRALMSVLLSFIGFHDPYGRSVIDGQKQVGPILTSLAERQFAAVVLLATPGSAANTESTVVAIEEHHPDCTVMLMQLSIEDPTDYSVIFKELRRSVRAVQKQYEDAHLCVSVSSGTPHMHACWIMLVASGELPATLIQSRPPQFVSGAHAVTEIDVHSEDFPEITPGTDVSPSATPQTAIAAICRRLGILGQSEFFTAALERAANLSGFDVHVLLLGETGSGKELFAKLIHAASPRADKPMITVNCAAFPDTLIESQLFGHVRGAFSGAVKDQKGKFALADGGTLFLDEIAEIPVASQAKLLRAIEHGEIEVLGSGKTTKVNVRVIAATNKEIRKAIREGQFREDLYYRFRGVVNIPPLRERRGDIPLLSQFVIERWNTLHQNPKRLAADALTALRQHPWPGNIRELFKVIEDSAITTGGRVIRARDLSFDQPLGGSVLPLLPTPHAGFDINNFCAEVRQELMEQALKLTDGNKAAAGRLLGITSQAVHQYFKLREEKK